MFSLLFFALAAEPQFVVVNKTAPTFTVVNKIPAPAVASGKPATFRRDNYNPSHTCQQCGDTQYRIAGWLPNGQHRHVCANGHQWVH